jgi:hypothetical protein
METQEITEEDVLQFMDQFTRVPPLLLKIVVSGNSNVIPSFRGQIEEYKNNLSQEKLLKIRKVMDMPTEELQEILSRVYSKTHQEQLKILADRKAKPFIEKNLSELEKILFNA